MAGVAYPPGEGEGCEGITVGQGLVRANLISTLNLWQEGVGVTVLRLK